jgi:hypothetical protein
LPKQWRSRKKNDRGYSGKNLLDFRPMRSITFPRLPRARKLDPMFRVCQRLFFNTFC